MLITIGSLIVIGIIFLLLYYKFKNEDESNYQKFKDKNEIEIRGNISGLWNIIKTYLILYYCIVV